MTNNNIAPHVPDLEFVDSTHAAEYSVQVTEDGVEIIGEDGHVDWVVASFRIGVIPADRESTDATIAALRRNGWEVATRFEDAGDGVYIAQVEPH